MTKPKFNNTPNNHFRFQYHTTHGNSGGDFWISRAIAVVGIVFVMVENTMKILITKRSDKMMDEAGKYGLPCGYLDWDETAFDAMVREIYEETSLYLPYYENYLFSNNNKQPFTFHDRPDRDKRQNVSLIYLSVYNMNARPDLFPVDILKYKDHETAEVQWMDIQDFYNIYEAEYQWAFKHNETINEAIKYFNNIDTIKHE